MSPVRSALLPRALYERWVREHHAAVWRAALRIVRDRALADDVVARVYLRVLEQPPKLEPAASPERLLCWLACKEALTELRARRRRDAREEAVAMRGETDPRPGPQDSASAADARAWLVRELDALSEELRQLLVLRFQQGLTFREIGELLDLSESSAHERAQRALAGLRAKGERAGLAGVLVNWEGELSACELAAAPSAQLATRLLQSGSASATLGVGGLLVPIAALCAVAIGALAWWAGRQPELGERRAVVEPAASAVAAGSEAFEPAEVNAGADRVAVAPVAQPAPAALGDVARRFAGAAAPPPPGPGFVRVEVRGRLLGADRLPLPEVMLRADPVELQKGDSQIAETDAGGVFRFELRTAVGKYQLQFEPVVRTAAEQVFDVASGEPLDLGDIVVEESATDLLGDWTLQLSVTDGARAPAAGIAVDLLILPSRGEVGSKRWSGATDAGGRLELRGSRRGTCRLALRDPRSRLQPHTQEIELATGTSSLELSLFAALSLIGRFELPPGEALDGAPLAARQPDVADWLYAEVDSATNTFRLDGLRDGPVTLSRSGGRFSSFERTVMAEAPGELVFRLKRADDPHGVGLHRGELHGRCVDVHGEPVILTSQVVLALPLPADCDGDFWGECAGSLKPFRGQVAFDLDGPPPPTDRFHLTGLAPGKYAIVVSHINYALGIAGPFEIRDDGDGGTILDGIELVFEPGWTVEVEVERVPDQFGRVDRAWIRGSRELGEPFGDVRPEVSEVRPAARMSWSSLHPRATYIVVLEGPTGAQAHSGPLIRPADGAPATVRFPHWPGRP